MKKLLLIAFSLLLITACGDDLPDLEDRTNQVEVATEYTGTIEEIPLNLYKDGTHQIKTLTDSIVIQSPDINLNQYVGKEVTVFGSMQKLINNIDEVFTVADVQFDGTEDENLVEFENKTFGFGLSYPDRWQLFETTDGLTLSANEVEWVKIEVVNTDRSLDELLETAEEYVGTAITVGYQRSMRFIDTDEIRIYIPNASRNKIYLVSFDDSQAESGLQKGLFFDMLESFTLQGAAIKRGEKCGGEEELVCPENFRCELESAEEKADGVCVPVDQEGGDLNCPFVPTPVNCLHYEVKSTNRDGCPTSYICLEVDSGAEELPETPQPTSEANVEPESVVDSFKKHQSKILPKGAEVGQFELVEAENRLVVVYLVGEKNLRTVYKYQPSANEYNFVKEAHYEEGEGRDWVLIEGDEPYIESEKKIIKPASEGDDIVIRDDMRLYENPHRNYSVQYPKNWYYRSFGPIENTVWTVGFGKKSIDDISDADVTLVIDDGAGSGKASMEGGRYIVEVNRDEDSHFILDGPLEMKDDLDFMASSIR